MLDINVKRRILELRDKGFKFAEIADIVSVSVGTAYKLCSEHTSKCKDIDLDSKRYFLPKLEFKAYGASYYGQHRTGSDIYAAYLLLKPPAKLIHLKKRKFYIELKVKANEFCEVLRNKARRRPLYEYIVRDDVLELARIIGQRFTRLIEYEFSDDRRKEIEKLKRTMKIINLVAGDKSIFESLDRYLWELEFKKIPPKLYYLKVMFWLIEARKEGRFKKKWSTKFYEIKDKLLEKKEADILAKYPLL